MALEVAPGSTSEQPAERQSSAWQRLEQQIDWYDRKSAHAKRWYHRLKVTQLLVAAAIPVTVAANADQVTAAVLGALIVVLEGFQQLFQFHANWTTYRSTCERLKHEKYLYEARGGPYSGENPEARLAERVEGLVSQEHAAWTTTQRDAKEGAK
jgi:Protein of unknown function (DUF4231)